MGSARESWMKNNYSRKLKKKKRKWVQRMGSDNKKKIAPLYFNLHNFVLNNNYNYRIMKIVI